MDITTAKLGANMAMSELAANGQIGNTIISKDIIYPSTKLEFIFDEEKGLALGLIGFDSELMNKMYAYEEKNLTFTFDGAKYHCAKIEANKRVFWGNLGFLGMDDTGEPFILGFDSTNGFAFICRTGGVHTVEISYETETVKPIDAKYIYPHIDLVAMGMPTVQIGGEVRVDVDAATHDKIASAMANGIITAAFTMDLQGAAIPAQGTLSIFFSASMGVYQGSCMLGMAGTPLMFIVTLESTWVSVTCLMLGA